MLAGLAKGVILPGNAQNCNRNHHNCNFTLTVDADNIYSSMAAKTHQVLHKHANVIHKSGVLTG
jgi:hypothetical protein